MKQVLLAEEVRDGPLFIIPEFLRPRVEVLKQLTWFYVIDNRAIKIQQQGQRMVVRELFEANYKAAGSADRDLHGILAESHLYLFDDSPDEAARARVVANLISSMTERQLLMTHKRLTGIELGSITDLT